MGVLSRLEAKSSDWSVLQNYLTWLNGGQSASGVIVSPQTAMQAAAVYSCVQVLSQSVGMLPLNLFTEDDKGERKIAKDHPLFELLHHQPNDWQTSVEFFEMMVASLCLRGNAYAYINRARSGRVVELLPIHPDSVRTEMSSDFQLTYYIALSGGGEERHDPGEIFHVRGLTLNGWLGISPIAYARESIGLALATEKFGGQLFRNGAKMGGVLEHPGKVGEEAYKRLKNSFDEAHSGENAHKTALLEEGMKFTKISMNADDSQFLETRKYQRSEIAAIFRVPPHMIGDLEHARSPTSSSSRSISSIPRCRLGSIASKRRSGATCSTTTTRKTCSCASTWPHCCAVMPQRAACITTTEFWTAGSCETRPVAWNLTSASPEPDRRTRMYR
jgi:HK97 family phage portal protein